MRKPTMVRVAFFKGKGTLRDRLVRLLTHGRYSRVELLVGHRLATGWHAYAARPDGGLSRRLFDIEAAGEDWDVLELPAHFTKSFVVRWFKDHANARFGYLQDAGFLPLVAGYHGSADAAARALDLHGYGHFTPVELYGELVDNWIY